MSTTGGIILKLANAPTPQQWFSKSEGQVIADCLSAEGQDDLAAKVQAIVDAAT